MILSALPAVAVVALLVPVVRKPKITLTPEGGDLHVAQGPFDVLYTLKRRLDLPLSQIQGIVVASREQIPCTGLRLPGTSVPGVIRAGSYGTGAARDFWNVRRGGRVLVIQLRPGASYRRVVLQVDDPEAEAARLIPTVGAYDGPLFA
ncbi:MAG: hypothetical protein QOJ49_821 [Actinomycetota bacterium]|nr:hypothetical protein [Actinomycetota bacterium]